MIFIYKFLPKCNISVIDAKHEYYNMACPVVNEKNEIADYFLMLPGTHIATVCTHDPIFNLLQHNQYIINQIDTLTKFPNYSIIQGNGYECNIVYVCAEIKKNEYILEKILYQISNNNIIKQQRNLLNTEELLKYIAPHADVASSDMLLCLIYDNIHLRFVLIPKTLYLYTLTYKINL